MKRLLKKIKFLHRFYCAVLGQKRDLRHKLFVPDYKSKRKRILQLAQKYQCTDVFIETGTFLGDTIEFLKKDFSNLISIELNENLAFKAIKRFKSDTHVKIFYGDSALHLSEILAGINSPAVIWLDGHYSAAFQAGNEYIITGRGEKETPILEELQQIKNHHSHRHLILIDDARLFNGENDYPKISEIKDFVRRQMPNYKVSIKGDVIRLLPNKCT